MQNTWVWSLVLEDSICQGELNRGVTLLRARAHRLCSATAEAPVMASPRAAEQPRSRHQGEPVSCSKAQRSPKHTLQKEH